MRLNDPIEYVKKTVKARTDIIYFIREILGSDPYPKQEEILREFYSYNEDGTPKYNKLFWCSGMRSGKSKCAAWIAAFELFKLCTLDNPATHYGLDHGSRITINIVATSTDTADDAIFGQLKHMLKASDFINEIINLDYRKEYIFCEEKNVKCQLLSSWSTTGVGRTAKLVVFDEISFLEETSGKRGAWELYTRLSKATATLGVHGRIVAISSPKHPNDVILTLIRKYRNVERSLCLITPTWEVNPNLTFESLMEECKGNLDEFWRDFGCKPSVASALEFPNGVKLEGENKALIHDEIDHRYLRVMAIDPAVKHDAFGLAFGYINEDGQIIVDGAYRFTKKQDQPYINTLEIKEFIKDIVMRYNIFAVVFDTWMYPELIQWMHEELGLIIEQHIVKKYDYDRVKELLDQDMLKICEYDILRQEMESLLVINEKRVDHPINGSKDVADCVANVVWYLTREDNDIPSTISAPLVKVI